MRKSKFTPHQIAKILKEFEAGKSSEEISREHGISKASFYKWRERYAGMSGKELKRIKGTKEGKPTIYPAINGESYKIPLILPVSYKKNVN